MKRRDLAWRAGGLAVFAFACAGGVADAPGARGSLGLLCFVLALIGVALVIQGKRVPAAWRIERSRHRTLAQAIHERRTSSRRGNG